VKCGIPLVSERETCTRCRAADFAFSAHRSLFSYTGAVKTLVAALKFAGRTRISRLFADLLWQSLPGSLADLPLVPVPGRRRHDAVDLTARSLKARHGARVMRLLERTGGKPQKSLDFEERRRNVAGRIRVVGTRGRLIPPDVVLLDDVFTTGATADACARVLLQAGCSRVSVMTIAMEE
jgi:predicted amidophosphoribosyltransferase